MEFIPLERYSKKSKKTQSVADEVGKKKKLKKLEKNKDESIKKIKPLRGTKISDKKNVKNKYRETLTQKRKSRAPKKKNQKKEDEVLEEEEEDGKEEEMVVDDEEVEEEEEEEEEEEADNDSEKDEDEEEVFRRKCQEMDEKKKNRLFVKLKKKILSEAQIKELHPDIRGVIFPRKKKSRWCWAVFASEERADEALKQLIKNKDVFATKPTPYDKVDQRRKEKMKTVIRRKQARKKLQEMWM